MDSIASRLGACRDSIRAIEQSIIENEPDRPDNWIQLDLVSLQVRKICELFLLGSMLAHLGEGKAEIDPRKWRPKDAFAQLNQVNVHPLPVPLLPDLIDQGSGVRQLQPASRPMPFAVLSSIYGHCGDLLHVPSAEKVLSERVTPFDIRKFKGWTEGFAQILAAHVLMLPALQSVLVCTWGRNPKMSPNIILLETDGPAVFAIDSLPEFSLLSI